MPKVSVIIPSYNHARYLSQRLDSVLGQTFDDFEVLFLDDCSPDDSRAVFESHSASSDSRVRSIFNQTNSGSTFKQWNRGLREARGEYVWFAESDDFADPLLLATLIDRLDANPSVGLAYCQSWWVDSTGAIIKPGTDHTDRLDREHWSADFMSNGRDECSRYMIECNTIPNASAVLSRREVLNRIGGAPEDMKVCGDWLMWVKMLLISDIAFVANPLNYFRSHAVTARSKSEQIGLNLEEHFRVQDLIARGIGLSRERRALLAQSMAWTYLSVLNGKNPPEIPSRRHLRLLRTMGVLDGRSSLPIVARALAQTLRRNYFPRENERIAAVGSQATAGGADLVMHLGAGREREVTGVEGRPRESGGAS